MATILLVDDISFIKRIEKKVLEENGHSIVGDASDGEQAIELFEKTRPDIVLMDITMPKVDGIVALEAILEKHPEAKIIMCSALSHKHVLFKAVKAGAKDYLVKPYTMERLLETISRVLKHP
ncbi:MAG: response regulator [Leptospirales bacterium]